MMNAPEPTFVFDNSYARDLEGFYVSWQGDAVPRPRIVRLNRDLARTLGLDPDVLDSEAGAAILCGAVSPAGATPLAQVYAGHQFGGFSPRLGDGRAILLGEVIDGAGRRRDIHLKGSGRTPFSRGGDGKAVLGPVLREYIVGEAMHALGVPTTRALAAVTTGQVIDRNGPHPGAVLARVAASHLRVGTFQYFAARGEIDKLRQLADYAIARHFPDLNGAETAGDSAEPAGRYLGLLVRVRDAQAALIAHWMSLGFVHGVMNTDNMTISGETIDYGPCAFIDAYDPKAVFSSIDRHGRYAFANQPAIAQWNLARFAETLLELINPRDSADAIGTATEVLEGFDAAYRSAWLGRMRGKIGLATAQAGDAGLIDDLLAAMAGQGADFTQVFRRLADAAEGDTAPARALFAEPHGFDGWLGRWADRTAQEPATPAARAAAMRRCNPVYVPRNHLVEAALVAAEAGDIEPFETLTEVLSRPFDVQPGRAAYAEPAPEGFGPYKTFCGT